MAASDNLQRLGELLFEQGIITAEELLRAADESGRRDGAATKLLQQCGHVRREELVAFLAKNFEIPQVNLEVTPCSAEALALVPESTARKHEIVPVDKIGNILCIARQNYFNRAAVIDLRKATGLKIAVLQCSEAQVQSAIDHYYSGKPMSVAAGAPAAPAPVPAPSSTARPTPVAPIAAQAGPVAANRDSLANFNETGPVRGQQYPYVSIREVRGPAQTPVAPVEPIAPAVPTLDPLASAAFGEAGPAQPAEGAPVSSTLLDSPYMSPYFEWPAIPAPMAPATAGEVLRALPCSKDDVVVAQKALKEEIVREWERLYLSGTPLQAIRIAK
ncbi:MAG: hypothetical protein HYZ53_22605 [Planctomycetes bacterium]|nr:hypothetical protein [Planctomycetota bacterium]